MPSIRRVLAVTLLLGAGAPASAAPLDADAAHARNLAAACTACHATEGAPGSRVASLAGWSEADVLQSLRAYRASDRRGDVMVQLAKGYTDAQLAQIASALASHAAKGAR